jgi:hypothetical protein
MVVVRWVGVVGVLRWILVPRMPGPRSFELFLLDAAPEFEHTE